MSRIHLFPALLLTTALFAPMAHAQDAPKWGAHVEAEGKYGTERSLGEVGLFAPLWQDDDTLFFTDIRGRIDSRDSSEGNFGLGLRHQVNNDWALGGYAFYDRRKTDFGNTFNQATIGVEALSENLEFRINGYIPESTEKEAIASSTSVAGAASGGNIQLVTTTTGATYERALPGADIEVGYKFDLPDNWEFWAHAGGFHFDASDYDNVSGPRGRVELSYDNVPYLGEGSRATLGFETQHDTVRGGQSWAIARLRVPLNFSGAPQRALTGLDKRMTTRIVRDIDIVSGNSTPTSTSSAETAEVALGSGATVSTYTILDAGDDVPADVTAAGANSLVVIDGSAGTIDNAATTINATNGQTIAGGGSTVTVTGQTSGASATLTLPGTRPTITGNVGTTTLMQVTAGRNNVTIQGINLTGGDYGIAFGGDSITIRDMTMENLGDAGFYIVGDNATISDITIDRPGGGGFAGVEIGAANNISFSNIRITNTTGHAFGAFNDNTANGINFSNVVVDNVAGAIRIQALDTWNNPSGSITGTNMSGTACLNNGTITASTLTINGVVCN